jgi:glycine/D-amino acid oxidase-like deaminating enzyme
MELIDGAAVRELVPPIRPDVLGASWCPEDAQINTPSVVRALADGARREGATICEGAPVEDVRFSGERAIGVETADGFVEADAVVIAAGAWAAAMLARMGAPVSIGAERLQILSTAPLPPQIGPLVYGPLAAKQYHLFRDLPSWDSEPFTSDIERETGLEMLQLVAQRATGEVLMGCPMDYPDGIDMRPTLAGLRATVESISADFPGLRDAPIDRTWAGVLPYTTDMAPVIDEARPGLFVAAGHVFGNAAGPMTGRLIAQLIAGRPPEIDLTECRFDRTFTEIDAATPTRW